MGQQSIEKPAFPEPPSLMPPRRYAGFWIKGALARERKPRTACHAGEHGEHPPLDAGSRVSQASSKRLWAEAWLHAVLCW